MKKVNFIIICILILFIINSCDFEGKTEIKIINESSYDLNIKFILKSNKITSFEEGQYKDIILNKNMSNSFILTALNEIRNPNNEVDKIILVNNSSNNIIKEIENKNTFVLSKSEKYKEYYQLKINNELLE